MVHFSSLGMGGGWNVGVGFRTRVYAAKVKGESGGVVWWDLRLCWSLVIELRVVKLGVVALGLGRSLNGVRVNARLGWSKLDSMIRVV